MSRSRSRELERLLVLSAMGGTTGWHYSITRHARYAPHLSNYSGARRRAHVPLGGRLPHRRAVLHRRLGHVLLPDPRRRRAGRPGRREGDARADGRAPPPARIRQLSAERLYLPRREPYMEGHNTWSPTSPARCSSSRSPTSPSTCIANLCFFAQNGYAIYDDVNGREIPGLEEFRGLVDVDEPFPLTFLEQYALTEATAELATALLRGHADAAGDGARRLDVRRDRPFQHARRLGRPGGARSRLPLRQGRALADAQPDRAGGVFEAYCPPHYPDMAAAVEAFAERKFGPGGPFHPDTPGAWTDSPGVRGSAQVHDRRVQGLRRAPGAVRPRHVRQVPRAPCRPCSS